jgi:hypothetical protein
MSNPFRSIATVLLLSASVLLAACGGSRDPEHLTFEVTIADGALTAASASTLQARQGDAVTLTVNADEPLTFHLHGYDLEHEVMPGMPTTIEFVADATGSFPFTAHRGGEAHSHDVSTGGCEAAIPAGAHTPHLHLSAAADPETGMVTASVEVDHFILGEGDGSMASGHWHLAAGGVTLGMYMEPSAVVMLEPGIHQLTATLSDDAHCSYPVSATTTVTVAGEGMAMDDGGDGHGHGDEEQGHEDAEVSLGRLDVLPR